MRKSFVFLLILGVLIFGCYSNEGKSIKKSNDDLDKVIEQKPNNIADEKIQIPARPKADPTYSGGLADPKTVLSVTQSAEPALGVTFTDPVFGTKIRRVTDTDTFGTHIYSQLQAFSDDNKYILLIENEIYVVRLLSSLENLNLDSSSWNAPRWQPGVKNTIIHYDSNEDEVLRLQNTNVENKQTNTVFIFPPEYKRIRVNPSFDELSRDGKWIAGMANLGQDDNIIFALDIENNDLTVEHKISDLYNGTCKRDPEWGIIEPDWIGVSPLGNYLVIQWPRDGSQRCSGLETFDIKTGEFTGRVYEGHQHGDLGVLADGKTEFFMTFEIQSKDNSGNPSQGIRILPGSITGSLEPTYLQSMEWGTQSHISCQGPNGVCLITSGNLEGAPFSGEIWLQYANGSVHRFAHHRSSECGYWAQPRATISADGKYIVFASDWGNSNPCGADGLGFSESYVLEVPSYPS